MCNNKTTHTMTPQKKFNAASNTIIIDMMFWAELWMRLNKVEDKTIPTMCTDGREVRWNPDFVDQMSPAECLTVQVHEIGHPMMGHLWRLKKYPHEIANLAGDAEINWMLEEMNERVELSNRGLGVAQQSKIPFVWPKKFPPYMPKEFRGMTAEKIADILMQRQGGSGGGSGDGSGQGNQQGQQPGQPGGSGNSMGEFTCKGMTSEQVAELKDRWETAVIQAANHNKGRGNMPSSLLSMVDAIENPRIPWQEVLRSYLGSFAKDDYTWKRPNSRYSATRFVMPSLHSERVGVIGIARDQSGSISDEQCADFLGQTQIILSDVRPAKIVVVDFDTETYPVGEFQTGDTIPGRRQCGGGTSFVSTFEYFNKVDDMKCLLILTDGDGVFPDSPPNYPVIWVVVSRTDWNPPFGDCVFMDV